MKHFHPFIILFLGLVLLANHACNDPTVIGSDLLAGNQLDIERTDTVTLNSYNIFVDSIATYDPDIFSNIASFPVGNFDDPVFGISRASVYAQVSLNAVFPDFQDAALVLDSIVLVMPYTSERSYGDFNELVSYEVYRVTEDFPDTVLYSDNEYTADVLIGRHDFFPAPEDSTYIRLPNTDSTVALVPQLRIRLDENNFESDFFNADQSVFDSVATFEDFFKGYHVKSTSINQGMPSYTFRNSSAGIRVYYHKDTVYSEYLFPTFSGNIVAANFVADNNSPILDLNEFVGEDAVYSDSLLFLQGMSGINFVLDMPFVQSLDNIVVNKAEIELPIAFLPDDNPALYSPLGQIIVSEILDDGRYSVIEDVTLAINRVGTAEFQTIFGGDVESDLTYRLNISSHFQNMIRGFATTKIVVTAFPKAEQAARVIINGPKHSTNPAKLNLTFTNF